MTEGKNFLYDAKYGGTQHSARPMYEVRNNQVFRTIYHPQGASVIPDFNIKGGKVYTTETHSSGQAGNAWYQVKGNQLHNTSSHPEGIQSGPSFHMHPPTVI